MEGLNKQKWGMESWKWETSSPESYFTQWSTNIIIPKQRPNVMASKCWADLLQATPQRQALGSPWKSRRWPCKPWVKLEGPEAPKLNMKNPWYSSHSVVYSGIGDGRWGHDVCFLDAWVQVPGNQNAMAMEDQVPELQALQEDNIGICGDGVDFHGIWIGWSWIHIPFLCWFVKSPEKYDMCRWFSRFYQKNVAIDWGQCTMLVGWLNPHDTNAPGAPGLCWGWCHYHLFLMQKPVYPVYKPLHTMLFLDKYETTPEKL